MHAVAAYDPYFHYVAFNKIAGVLSEEAGRPGDRYAAVRDGRARDHHRDRGGRGQDGPRARGHVALAGYIGGARAPEAALAPAGELIEAARAAFRELLGARGAAVVARVRQWPRGLPQYRLGHTVRVAALGALEDRRPGLFVTGNYIGGPSLGNCVAQAVETAARVERFLTGMPATRQREAAAVDAATPGRSGAAS